MNGFAELSATLVSALGCHVSIHFKRVGFKLYIYTYIYIYIFTHIYILTYLACRLLATPLCGVYVTESLQTADTAVPARMFVNQD